MSKNEYTIHIPGNIKIQWTQGIKRLNDRKSLFSRDFFYSYIVTRRSINYRYILLVGMEQKTFTEHNLTFVST